MATVKTPRSLILIFLFCVSCVHTTRSSYTSKNADYYATERRNEIKNHGVLPLNQARSEWSAESQDKNPYLSMITAGISYLIKDKEKNIRGQVLCKKHSDDAVPLPCPVHVRLQLIDSKGRVTFTEPLSQGEFTFWLDNTDLEYEIRVVPNHFKVLSGIKERITAGSRLILTLLDTASS